MKLTKIVLVAIALAGMQSSAATWYHWKGGASSLLDISNWTSDLANQHPITAIGDLGTTSGIMAFVSEGSVSATVDENCAWSALVVSGDSHLSLSIADGKKIDGNSGNVNIGYNADNYPNESNVNGPDTRPSLEVSGVLTNAYFRLGTHPDLLGADLTVKGAGTHVTWYKNTLENLVGLYQGGSTLCVKDGATLYSPSVLNVGGGTISSTPHFEAHNNVFTVKDGSTLIIPAGLNVGNKSTNNVAEIKSSTVATPNSNLNSSLASSVGGASEAMFNRLVIDNSTWGGAKDRERQKFHVGKSGSDWNTLVVTNGSTMYVSEFNCGYSGDSNRVEIAGGSYVWANGAMAIAASTSATCGWNEMDVSGAGTVLTNSANAVYVGRNGPYNRMTVRDGAFWRVDDMLYIGVPDNDAKAAYVSNNVVEVSGAGTSVSIGGMMRMGRPCSTLRVKDGAAMTVTAASTESGPSAGSVVGMGGAGVSNRVEVLNGASLTVSKNSLTIGNLVGSDGCGLLVDNATATLGSSVFLGNNASSNSMEFVNGAVCTCRSFYLGYKSSSCDNVLRIAGEGTWVSNKADKVYIGYAGKRNRLIVEDKAFFNVSNDLYIAGIIDTSTAADGAEVIVRSGGRLRVAGTPASSNNGNGIFVSANYTGDTYPRNVRLVVDGGEIETDQAIITQRESEFLVRGSSSVVKTAQLRFADTAKLTFESDNGGFSTIRVKATSAQSTAKCNFATKGTYLTIDATKYARAGGGTQTLINSSVNLSTGFQAAVNNDKVTLIPEGTTIDFTTDPKKLVVTVPSKLGMIILVR
ncbi:MAG: hypothetical protein II840_05760 [Kiritimatiellae bacterium]|nr:hypothetical protein [Kiritimatiellia bacterium]